jgi:hypothetical protein
MTTVRTILKCISTHCQARTVDICAAQLLQHHCIDMSVLFMCMPIMMIGQLRYGFVRTCEAVPLYVSSHGCVETLINLGAISLTADKGKSQQRYNVLHSTTVQLT